MLLKTESGPILVDDPWQCAYDPKALVGSTPDALAITRDTGNRQNEGATLGNLGNCYYRLGEYQGAIDQYAQALAIARDIGDRQGEAGILFKRGEGLAAQGEPRLAQGEDAFRDGVRALPIGSAEDHKRIFDDDRGPNTGGMGAYSPAPVVTSAMHQRSKRIRTGRSRSSATPPLRSARSTSGATSPAVPTRRGGIGACSTTPGWAG